MKIDSPTFLTETTFISASVQFSSGSQKFGDTTDDTHERTGSLNLTGSFSLNGYQINEISSDSGFTDESTTAVVTEAAVAGFTGGDLILPDYDIEIKSYNNRTFIFPSFIKHGVVPVKMEEQYRNTKSGRFCISQFGQLDMTTVMPP